MNRYIKLAIAMIAIKTMMSANNIIYTPQDTSLMLQLRKNGVRLYANHQPSQPQVPDADAFQSDAGSLSSIRYSSLTYSTLS